MGTPQFAVPSLKALLDNGHDIAAVVTVPDKPKGRGMKVSVSDVKKFALENDLKILQPEKLKDSSFIEEIMSLKPDLIVVVAFRILPKEIFSIPVKGSINLHASLLPAYRGAAPINRTIMNGDKETGVTTFFLKEKVDTGNIILQEKINIEDNDNAGTLHDKLSVLGADTVLRTVNMIDQNAYQAEMQDDTIASPAPKIFKEDCLIGWENNCSDIYNFIRGLSPYPAAFTYLGQKQVRIFAAKPSALPSVEKPGCISVINKILLVSTGDFMLEVLELQTEGRKRMTANEFMNGFKDLNKSCFSNKAIQVNES